MKVKNLLLRRSGASWVSVIVDDIGIKVSEEKYNSSAGKYQELEGPHEAEKLLAALGYEKTVFMAKFGHSCGAKTIHLK